MTKTKLPKSVRIHIRRKKAEIRRAGGDTPETKQKILELVAQVRGRYTKKEK